MYSISVFGYQWQVLENISLTQDLFMSKEDQANFWNKKLTILKELEMTRFGKVEDFWIDRKIRRDEVAKMLTIFAEYTNHDKDNVHIKNDTCTFRDLASAHSDLHDYITLACQKNIFKWNMWKFNPTNYMTNGEFVATVIRTIEWKHLDEVYRSNGEKIPHRAQNYLDAAMVNELLRDTVFLHSGQFLDNPVLRWDVAIVFANYIEKYYPKSCFHPACDQKNFHGHLEYQSHADAIQWQYTLSSEQK